MNIQRTPIVTVLGHVDHGKTTLLDTIRGTKIASREAGGITQSTLATKVVTKEGTITFIDTPGHAVFAQMRSRGAKVADIALLIVSADDGPKPQTIESIQFIREAELPFIVVFTKVDLASAEVEKAKGALEQQGILFEGRGGSTPCIEVSAKTGSGINELLELILLVAEVSGIESSDSAPLEAVVIETNKDKRGLLVSAIVRNGTLNVGSTIVAEGIVTKVRGLFDSENKSVKTVSAGDGVTVLGFSELPPIGSPILDAANAGQTVHAVANQRKEVQEGEYPVILKTATAGALEAIVGNLPKFIVPIFTGVGDVTESDIFLAKSANAKIVTFEAKVPNTVAKLADTEGVKIAGFSIIYELFKDLEDIVTDKQKVVVSRALILDIFPYENRKVAGCRIMDGTIKERAQLILMRGEKELGNVRVASIRKGKMQVKEVKAGEECGLLIEGSVDFDRNDVLVSFA